MTIIDTIIMPIFTIVAGIIIIILSIIWMCKPKNTLSEEAFCEALGPLFFMISIAAILAGIYRLLCNLGIIP